MADHDNYMDLLERELARCFRPSCFDLPPNLVRGDNTMPTPLQEETKAELVERLLSRGGLTRAQVAEAAGCSRSLVAYVARRMNGGGTTRRTVTLNGPVTRRIVAELEAGITNRATIAATVGCSVARVGQVANELARRSGEHRVVVDADRGLVDPSSGESLTVDTARERLGLPPLEAAELLSNCVMRTESQVYRDVMDALDRDEEPNPLDLIIAQRYARSHRRRVPRVEAASRAELLP